MSNLNRITVIGKVFKKPEIKVGAEPSSSMARFMVMADRPARPDGSAEHDVIPVIAWGKNADYVAENLSEGSVAIVEGRIEIRTVEDAGQKKWLTEVKASSVKKMEIGATSTPNQSSVNASNNQDQIGNNPFDSGFTEDDVPF